MIVAARGAKHLIRFSATLILARLLSPADFGLIAIVVSAIGIGHIFRDMGMSTIIVQRKDLTSSQVNSMFWLSVGLGLLLTLICALLAPLLVIFYDDPRALGVTIALATMFILASLSGHHMALLRRQLQFAMLARMSLLSAAMAAAAALAIAMNGGGFWALVAFNLTGDLVRVILAWHYCRWRPGWPRLDPSIRTMVSFGGYLVAFAVMTFLGRNLHNILIGRAYGTASVGLYNRANSLLLMISNYSATTSGTITLSALSRYQDDPKKFRNFYCKAVRVIMMAAAPIACFMALHANDVIRLAFGDQWDRSGDILGILALSMLVHPVIFSSGWIFLSLGNARGLMCWGAIGWAVAIGMMLIGLPYGLEGVAAAFTLSQLVLVWPNLAFATRGTTIRLSDVFRSWIPSATAAALSGAVSYLAQAALVDWPLLIRLTLSAGLYGLVYLALLGSVCGQRDMMLDLLAQFRRSKSGKATA